MAAISDLVVPVPLLKATTLNAEVSLRGDAWKHGLNLWNARVVHVDVLLVLVHGWLSLVLILLLPLVVLDSRQYLLRSVVSQASWLVDLLESSILGFGGTVATRVVVDPLILLTRDGSLPYTGSSLSNLVLGLDWLLARPLLILIVLVGSATAVVHHIVCLVKVIILVVVVMIISWFRHLLFLGFHVVALPNRGLFGLYWLVVVIVLSRFALGNLLWLHRSRWLLLYGDRGGRIDSYHVLSGDPNLRASLATGFSPLLLFSLLLLILMNDVWLAAILSRAQCLLSFDTDVSLH